MDLLLVDWRQILSVATAPDDLVVLVQVGALVCDRKHLSGVADFLSADAERVTWNPDEAELGCNGRVVVCVTLNLVRVLDGIGLRRNATERLVVAVDVGTKPLGEEVGSLVGSRVVEGRVAAICDGLMRGLLGGSSTVMVTVAFTVLGGEQTLLLGADRLGKGFQVRGHCAVQADVVQCGEDQHDDHQDKRTKSTTGVHLHVGTLQSVGRRHCGTATCQCEKADEADFSDIQTNKDLLQCARVDGALGVDICVVDEEHVVAEREVEQVETDSSEQKNQRSNSGVADCDDLDMKLATGSVMSTDMQTHE